MRKEYKKIKNDELMGFIDRFCERVIELLKNEDICIDSDITSFLDNTKDEFFKITEYKIKLLKLRHQTLNEIDSIFDQLMATTDMKLLPFWTIDDETGDRQLLNMHNALAHLFLDLFIIYMNQVRCKITQACHAETNKKITEATKFFYDLLSEVSEEREYYEVEAFSKYWTEIFHEDDMDKNLHNTALEIINALLYEYECNENDKEYLDLLKEIMSQQEYI